MKVEIFLSQLSRCNYFICGKHFNEDNPGELLRIYDDDDDGQGDFKFLIDLPDFDNHEELMRETQDDFIVFFVRDLDQSGSTDIRDYLKMREIITPGCLSKEEISLLQGCSDFSDEDKKVFVDLVSYSEEESSYITNRPSVFPNAVDEIFDNLN